MNHAEALRAAADAVPPDLQGMLTLEEITDLIRSYLAARNDDDTRMAPTDTFGLRMSWTRGDDVTRPVLMDEIAYALMGDFDG